ncbi:MAG: glycosyltransferase family 2 protein [Candidatus Eremiobacteraeota bacterium]|nr:glycosyltransferase family 2 protein [Candidatus Eremiobacteraeota bacterium]
MLTSKITAIMVTYQPNLEVLNKAVDAILPQITDLVIIDNGSKTDMKDWIQSSGRKNTSIIPLLSNLGIAAAQNIGIRWAKERGSNFVLFMDQDSIPDSDMVSKLVAAYWDLTIQKQKKVSAIGPCLRNNRGYITKHECLKCRPWFGIRLSHCRPEYNAVPSDFLISSGLLIETNTLTEIGDMDESLFIDSVDTEWLLRARSKGYQGWGHVDSKMTHLLGEYYRRIWLFRWHYLYFHKPFRYYYMFRNRIILLRRKYPCTAWKYINSIRSIKQLFLVILLHKDRFQALRMILRGIMDGVKGVRGKALSPPS